VDLYEWVGFFFALSHLHSYPITLIQTGCDTLDMRTYQINRFLSYLYPLIRIHVQTGRTLYYTANLFFQYNTYLINNRERILIINAFITPHYLMTDATNNSGSVQLRTMSKEECIEKDVRNGNFFISFFSIAISGEKVKTSATAASFRSGFTLLYYSRTYIQYSNTLFYVILNGIVIILYYIILYYTRCYCFIW
jgi:hypothetical protein